MKNETRHFWSFEIIEKFNIKLLQIIILSLYPNKFKKDVNGFSSINMCEKSQPGTIAWPAIFEVTLSVIAYKYQSISMFLSARFDIILLEMYRDVILSHFD